MKHVLQLLEYDLSCHSEDFSIANDNLIKAIKNKKYDEVEYLKQEKIKLFNNMKELRQAIKILNKKHNE